MFRPLCEVKKAKPDSGSNSALRLSCVCVQRLTRSALLLVGLRDTSVLLRIQDSQTFNTEGH